ncbi:hypothetical protein N7522_009996 [Penicillium canescens]|nr:hypothetical protein N7522_009996 [Penicillium canescens]
MSAGPSLLDIPESPLCSLPASHESLRAASSRDICFTYICAVLASSITCRWGLRLDLTSASPASPLCSASRIKSHAFLRAASSLDICFTRICTVLASSTPRRWGLRVHSTSASPASALCSLPGSHKSLRAASSLDICFTGIPTVLASSTPRDPADCDLT